MSRKSSKYEFDEDGLEFLESEEEVRRQARAPVSEMLAKVVVTFSVSMARAFLEAPTQTAFSKAAESRMVPASLREKVAEVMEEEDDMDFAAVAQRIITASTRMLKQGGLSRPEFEMTGEAFSVLLRLATQFMGPVNGLNGSEVYDAVKTYMYLQQHARPAGQERVSLRNLMKLKFGRKTVPVTQIQRYTRYTMAAYGALAMKFLGVLPRSDREVWSNTQAIEYLTGINTDENLVTARWRANWVGSIYKPGHFVLVDHENKEVIVAIRGSYRFQDSITDLMCEDTPFTFTYDRAEDFASAEKELGEVFNSLGDAISGLTDNLEDKTIGELEREVMDAAKGLMTGLQGLVYRHGRLLGEELREALDDSDESEDEDGEDEKRERIRRRQEKTKEGAEEDEEVDLERDLSRRSSVREPTQYMTKVKSRANASIKHPGGLDPETLPEGHRLMQGKTHFGFLKAAQVLASELEDVVVKTMEKNSGYKLMILGHSLGSAVASLLTLMWAKHPILGVANCYGIAAPASLSLDIAESAIATSKITSVILHDDLVPRLSLGSVSDLRNSISYIATHRVKGDKKGRTITEFVKDALASDMSESKLSSLFQPIMERIRKKEHVHPKLYPPGVIYHIPVEGATIANAIKKKSSDFDELVLSPGMFMAHVPHSYAYAICDMLPLSAAEEKRIREESRRSSNRQRGSLSRSGIEGSQE